MRRRGRRRHGGARHATTPSVRLSPAATSCLHKAFRHLRAAHAGNVRQRAARVVLGASVLRVFAPGTKAILLPVLARLPVDELRQIRTARQFRTWFNRHLLRVARAVRSCNRRNRRIRPGDKWGHSTKLLTLFLRELVLNSRYFSDRATRRIAPWLFVPLDSIVITQLRDLGFQLSFRRIRDIDRADLFYGVQDHLGVAAVRANVPRIWFDDFWTVRD